MITDSTYTNTNSVNTFANIKRDIVKSSFFDEIIASEMTPQRTSSIWLTSEDYNRWLKTKIKIPSNHLKYRGELLKKSSNPKENFTKVSVQLFKDRLGNKEIDKILILEGTKMETNDVTKLENQKEFSPEHLYLFFSYNKQYDVLFTETLENYKIWIKKLSKICVLEHFSKYYNCEKIIGKGTFAKVLLCQKYLNNCYYAVKTYDKKSLTKSKEGKNALLNHKHCLKLHAVFEGEYHIYLILDLLKGGELFDCIVKQGGAFSERESAVMIAKVLSALAHIHSKKIMHRDLKPENLIFRKKNSIEDIVLADFGLAEQENKKKFLYTRCGTPGYVAPEVLQDKPYTTKVDIFSAGVIFYILLTGISPFYSQSYTEIVKKNKKGDVDFNFKELNIKLSDSTMELLKSMLEKNPEARPSAEECLKFPFFKILEDDIDEANIDMDTGMETSISKKMEHLKINVKQMNQICKKNDIMLSMNSQKITGRLDSFTSPGNNSITVSPEFSPKKFERHIEAKMSLFSKKESGVNDGPMAEVDTKTTKTVKNKLLNLEK